MPPKRISVGRISKTVGLAGRLKINLYSKGSDSIKGIKKFFIALESGEFAQFEVNELSLTHASANVKFAGIDTEKKAGELVGSEIFIDSDELPKLKSGEFYHHELLGSMIYSVKGEYLGKLTGIFSTKANDVWSVEGVNGGEFLIPATPDIIKEIDILKKIVKIDVKAGLLDD